LREPQGIRRELSPARFVLIIVKKMTQESQGGCTLILSYLGLKLMEIEGQRIFKVSCPG
jgi:hypothetical protein